MARSKAFFLSRMLDLKSLYGTALRTAGPDIEVLRPEEVPYPEKIRFAACWLAEADSFAAYPNLELVMSIGAGVDDLLSNSKLSSETAIARMRDPHQAALMAGYAAHEVLHVSRNFAQFAASASRAAWEPLPMQAPEATIVTVPGNGTMGEAVIRILRGLGFTLRVACRTDPDRPIEDVSYFSGADGVIRAAAGAHFVINILPLTQATEAVLNSTLFLAMAQGSWLIQIGRGEHLVESDLIAALDSCQLAGATLDVFHAEPLPEDHPFWHDDRLRITPHIASASVPSVVTEQIVTTARELREGAPLSFGVERARGY
ncbi:NAD(P)-dependent oxidoreductase [Roseinatronobacter alkalisoli]|uniref:NAD(P)-dependent oxidoreductase n=1 Tax=Roseinatronobacter alkalisoli TaxID=3028235 RepID=A0ABT5TDQ3_9RHOB|nr:NAD(P)-dependent oxidoreductase [Roseinatronobacter sp. HJB301]MDD7972830.1 NAD(P)-dependent oxidoreductase [Roseinatronobacter sp. HJB301]